MRDILEEHSALLCEQIYIEDQLAIIHGAAEVFQLVIKQDPPFSINDRRLGIIVRGEIDANINLVERHIAAGSIVYIGPGSIVSPVKLSPDLEIYGFGVSTDFPLPFAPNQMPQAFNGQVRDFQIKVSQSDLDTAAQILDTLWHLVRQKGYNRQTAASLIAAQMHHYDGINMPTANLTRATANRLSSTASSIWSTSMHRCNTTSNSTPTRCVSQNDTSEPLFGRQAEPRPKNGSTAPSPPESKWNCATATRPSHGLQRK